MQTSTSINDLKRTSNQDTDDLVNDILKELQTTPLSNTHLPAPSNSELTFEQDSTLLQTQNKTEKNNKLLL